MVTQGLAVWFTGLPGSGKTTISLLVEQELCSRGLKTERLDSDVVRRILTPDLGYSIEDRWRNARRVIFVTKLLVRNGVAVLCAMISPLRAMRCEARGEIDRFVEVYCRAPLEVLVDRDTSGLYARALRGEIPDFTGISSPYEEPQAPEVLLETNSETPQQSARKVILTLEKLAYIPPVAFEGAYTLEEERAIVERLRSLGYL
jgi:adenylyl-sulfate kinase